MRRDRALVALVVLLVFAGACTQAPAATNSSSNAPEPVPSIQPVPGPPVANARRMRDEFLTIAAADATTDTAIAWGIKAAWARVFPNLGFAAFESPATTDTISAGESLASERENELTTTLTFAVVDGIGTCAGGYMSGPVTPGGPIRFERLDPIDACTASAVYLVKNPVPEPEPEVAPARRRSGKAGGSGGSSGPQTRTGHLEKRDLGSDTVTRKLSGA